MHAFVGSLLELKLISIATRTSTELAVLRSGLELPLSHRFDGLFIEAILLVERLTYFDVAYTAVLQNDYVKKDSP